MVAVCNTSLQSQVTTTKFRLQVAESTSIQGTSHNLMRDASDSLEHSNKAATPKKRVVHRNIRS